MESQINPGWAGKYMQFCVKLDMWYKLYHINLYVKWFQYSICNRFEWKLIQKSLSLSDLHSFTLYPSLRPYGQTDGGRVKYTRFVWAGGTFFPVVLYVMSVFGSGGKKVLVCIRMYYFTVQYSCGGVLVFWLQWKIFFSVLRILSVQYSCAVVSVY